MDKIQVAGPKAGVVKYDIITALTVAGLNGEPGFQLSMSRLISLITARYNWRSNSITMGQKEMSQLWGIGDRTVKREIKRWLETGLLICLKPGVKGRVATYRLNMSRVCEISQPIWDRVGSDFAERMSDLQPDRSSVIRLETRRAPVSETSTPKKEGWPAVSAVLSSRFPSQYDAWIAPLVAVAEQERLVLEARSAFAAEYIRTHFGRDICEAVQAEWGRSITVLIRSIPAQDLRKSPV